MSVITKTKRKPQSSSNFLTPSGKRLRHASVLTTESEDATSPVEQYQLSQFTKRRCIDCDFVGPVEQFKGTKSSALSQRCIQCRALEASLAKYRADWGPTADFDHQALVELVIEQLEKWADRHRPFPASTDHAITVAEMAESKVCAWGKRPLVNKTPMSSFQQPCYTWKKRTRSSASVARHLSVSADQASPPTLTKERQGKLPCNISPTDLAYSTSVGAYSRARATSIPDSEPPEDPSGGSGWLRRSRGPPATERQSGGGLMAQFFPEDPVTNLSSTASPAASTVTDISHAEVAYGDQALGEYPLSQPSIASNQASTTPQRNDEEFESVVHENADADDPQLFTNAAQFLHTIADGLDRLSREPVQQRRYFARLLGLDIM